jgi:predicted component of type VI protein secretion system
MSDWEELSAKLKKAMTEYEARMEAVKSLPAPTLEEVEAQMLASAEVSRKLDQNER